MNQSRVYSPKTVEEAWLNLAFAILLLAIEDVRQTRDTEKKEFAKAWLLSPAAELFFDEIIDPDFDLHKWILDDCPIMDKK